MAFIPGTNTLDHGDRLSSQAIHEGWISQAFFKLTLGQDSRVAAVQVFCGGDLLGAGGNHDGPVLDFQFSSIRLEHCRTELTGVTRDIADFALQDH